MQENTRSMAPVSSMTVETRATFIWKCYAHVVGAIFALIAIEYYLFITGSFQAIARVMMNSPIMVMIGFVALSWGAGHVAHRLESITAQYAAFALFVVLWAIMFVPILGYAIVYGQAQGINFISDAATITVFGSIGLIATAMITRKDFSFLRGVMVYGFFIAIGLIVASLLFGFQLGNWFSVAMIGFAGVAVLYDTSNIMHHYPQDKYVAASMALFASIAMMFFYILRLLMNRD